MHRLIPALMVVSFLGASLAHSQRHAPMELGFKLETIGPTCGDEKLAEAYGIAAPALPHNGPALVCPPVSDDYHCVATTEELQEAVNNLLEPSDIVLEDGFYEPEGLIYPFLRLPRAHRLYAQNNGAVVLRFGVSVGGSGSHLIAPSFHGLTISIEEAEHAVPVGPYGRLAALAIWGDAHSAQVQDVRLTGSGVVHDGLHVTDSHKLTVERVVVKDFLHFGVFVEHDGNPANPVRALISDVFVEGVGDPAYELLPECDEVNGFLTYCPGTREVGIWLGEVATLERARVRRVHYTGIETAGNGEVVESIIMRDIDVDHIGDDRGADEIAGAGHGIGFEKTTHDVDLGRFCIGKSVERGVDAEWTGHEKDFTQAARRLVVHDGVIDAWFAGVYFDYGTLDGLLHKLTLRNQRWAGVGLYHNHFVGETQPTTTLRDITFLPAPGACTLTLSLYGTACDD